MFTTLGLVLLIALEQMTMAPAKPNCQVPNDKAQSMLAANYDTFDQSMSDAASWRPLMNTGCYSGAASIISKYRESHKAELNAEQIRTLYFHEGQVLAFDNQNAESIRAFEHAKDSSASAEWNAYVDANVAFLKHDRAAMSAAREAYAKLVKANSPRLGVIDGLLACLGKSYREGVACGSN